MFNKAHFNQLFAVLKIRNKNAWAALARSGMGKRGGAELFISTAVRICRSSSNSLVLV
jgi:hypothetical protein